MVGTLVGEGVGQRRLSARPAHSCSGTVLPPVPKAVSGNGFLHVPSLKACLEQREMCPSSLARQKNKILLHL